MKTTIYRSYFIGCKHCKAIGIVPAFMDGTNVTTVCPVCNGAKVVMVNETETIPDDLYGTPPIKVNPYDVQEIQKTLKQKSE